jgi:hypothetical protein
VANESEVAALNAVSAMSCGPARVDWLFPQTFAGCIRIEKAELKYLIVSVGCLIEHKRKMV